MIKLAVIFCFFNILFAVCAQDISNCVSQENCNECISQPGCVWCAKPVSKCLFFLLLLLIVIFKKMTQIGSSLLSSKKNYQINYILLSESLLDNSYSYLLTQIFIYSLLFVRNNYNKT